MLRDSRGAHFDPDLLDLFLANLDTMRAIREGNPDQPPEQDETEA